MTVTRFEQVFFGYFDQFKRLIDASPLLLGAGSGIDGGFGGRPGGFLGYLPQGRVAFDTTEAGIWTLPSSGLSLVDNLNRIRFRLANIEAISQGLSAYMDGVLISSGVTVIDFLTDTVVQTSPGHITISGEDIPFTALIDVPQTYAGQGNKYLTVKGDTTGIEFTTVVPSGDTLKVRVSSNDTTEDYLENKIVAGVNIQLAVLNEAGNEQILITSISGVTDHGLLSGLLDDDHTQYLTVSRHDLIARHTLGTVVPHDALPNLTDVSIASPVTGDTIVFDGSFWINSSAGSAQRVMTFGQPGNLSVKTLEARLFAPFDGTIANVVTTVNTPPTGTAIIVDIYKNGATIYGTNPANRPTISGGNYNDMVSIPDITTFTTDDLFTVGIIQVGTTISGADMVLQIRCLV